MYRVRTGGFTINYYGFATDCEEHSAVTSLQQSHTKKMHIFKIMC